MGLLQLLSNKKPKTSNSEPLKLQFCVQAGLRTFRQAPHVTFSVRGYQGRESHKGLGRIDTGADLSSIPRAMFREIAPVPIIRPIMIRDHAGKQQQHYTFRIEIILWNGDRPYSRITPVSGVILREDNNAGLIGMDVLSHFRLEGEGKDWKLLPRKAGQGT